MKKVLGFDISYLKKEAKEPASQSQMSSAMLAKEKKESKTHETKEHAAVTKLLKMMGKKK